ncbi:hypothetical protein NHJ13051_004964 [Beauveria bassiana]
MHRILKHAPILYGKTTRWAEVRCTGSRHRPSRRPCVRPFGRRRVDRRPATIILLDALESLLAKDRLHHDAIVETLAGELDALMKRAAKHQRMPLIVVVAAYLEFTANVLAEL